MSPRDRLDQMHAEMTEWRRDFHAHPEIGFEEVRTSEIVAQKLGEWGIEVHRGLGGTGVVGVIRGQGQASGGNRAIGLRADMDALPMDEGNSFAHRSQNPGRMHACGHDGHTAMLLGAAKYLSQTRKFAGTVHLIFQPAEEGLAGAKAMLDDGLFEKFPCDAVYGIHNSPDMPLGTVKALSGTAMAAIDYFSVVLRGKSAHGAHPQQGIDTVSIAAQVVSVLNALPSRHVDALESAIVSIGQIHGGTSDIVIPETVELRGSVRTLKPEIRDLMEGLFKRAVEHTAAAQGGTAEISYRRAYPATINSAHETDRASLCATNTRGVKNVIRDGRPLLAGEDFAFMLERAPGAYLFFGQNDGAKGGVPVHNPAYDFNDDLLPIGASYLAGLVEQELG
ncbi:MAG: amidohydrolase [Rhodoblastus sp.]|nr:amidohydrolase [Rhodoblastus sp.]MCB1525557.1 amidohydrolase [Rhodoblastus sp.]MCC0001082.1 amidohydrolase [Methylobacteriaceae bacterium]MCO5085781.1 M20 family metallopeptidase [Methylobacteriaceae bacterium]HPG02156.1 M20 aminoacylase family protein [Rhodoblastus sp.]